MFLKFLLNVLQKDLKYRFRVSNVTQLVKSKIGAVYNVEYNRKTKIFTLKKEGQCLFALYRNNKKHCTITNAIPIRA